MRKNFLQPGKKPRSRPGRPRQGRASGKQDLRQSLLNIYQRMLAHFGFRNWWPGDTEFEMMIGAILTQNTSWSNVERAISNLKAEKLLSPGKLRKVKLKKLEQLIRPSGYFRQKAKRIKIFLDFFFAPPINGSFAKMKSIQAKKMREMLLAVKGIGPETADSILLYALDKPVFVVDAYTRRIFSQLGFIDQAMDYEGVRSFFEKNLPLDLRLYNDYHAQIVAVGKNYCKKRARCTLCPLFELRRCKQAKYSRQ